MTKEDEEIVEEVVYGLPDEEVACRLVKLYVEEAMRLGDKRKMDLDTIINAYFYSLQRLKRKEEELSALEELVDKEEKELLSEKGNKDLIGEKEDAEELTEDENKAADEEVNLDEEPTEEDDEEEE